MSGIEPGYQALEDLGRIRVSKNFFMRDFLYSETANHFRLRNFPDNPDLAIEVAVRLCENVLEPLQAVFGRVHIRSAFRSEELNQFCNAQGLNCASNERARGSHIWDSPDAQGMKGAMACIVLPWLVDACDAGMDWREMAWWIHDNLEYSAGLFYAPLYAINIAWRETPNRVLIDRISDPNATLTPPGERGSPELKAAYAGLSQRLTG